MGIPKNKYDKVDGPLNTAINRLESYIKNGYAGDHFGQAHVVLDGLKRTKEKLENNEPSNAANEIAKVFYFGSIDSDKWSAILQVRLSLLTCRIMDLDGKKFRNMDPDWDATY